MWEKFGWLQHWCSPLTISNREVKTNSADGTTNLVGEYVAARPI